MQKSSSNIKVFKSEHKVMVNNFNHARKELEAKSGLFFPSVFPVNVELHLSLLFEAVAVLAHERKRFKGNKKLCLYSFFFLFVSEINRVRLQLFHHKGNGRIPLDLPEPIGPVQTISEKLYVPVKEHPDVSIKHYISYLRTSTQSFICEADRHYHTCTHMATSLHNIIFNLI